MSRELFSLYLNIIFVYELNIFALFKSSSAKHTASGHKFDLISS